MKKYLIALFSGCSILAAFPAMAATPVTIQNAANTDAVTITNHGLNVNVTAGSAIIGNVRIDQTTPGTTNGVQTLTGSTTSVTQATAANLNATVVGTVTTSPLDASSTDASGTVTTGTTYQTVLASSATRKGCLIQNPTTATEILSIKIGTMAAPFTILAGGTFSCASGSIVVTDAITITAPTTGHAFSAVYQ